MNVPVEVDPMGTLEPHALPSDYLRLDSLVIGRILYYKELPQAWKFGHFSPEQHTLHFKGKRSGLGGYPLAPSIGAYSNTFCYGVMGAAGKLRVYYSPGQNYIAYPDTKNTYEVRVSPGSIEFNGDLQTVPVVAWTEELSGNPQFFSNGGTIEILRIEAADMVLSDLVPCKRKSDGKNGLYDICDKNGYFIVTDA